MHEHLTIIRCIVLKKKNKIIARQPRPCFYSVRSLVRCFGSLSSCSSQFYFTFVNHLSKDANRALWCILTILVASKFWIKVPESTFTGYVHISHSMSLPPWVHQTCLISLIWARIDWLCLKRSFVRKHPIVPRTFQIFVCPTKSFLYVFR